MPQTVTTKPLASSSTLKQNYLEIRNPSCKRCELSLTCKTVCLMGRGKLRAPIMLVGEAPGATEDNEGKPFIGRSGEALQAWLERLGMENMIYITNAVKCRPQKNTTPNADHAYACGKYLRKEIKLIKPIAVVTLGKTAMMAMSFGDSHAFGDHCFVNRKEGNYFLGFTYHPAYFLRAGAPIDAYIMATLSWAKRMVESQPCNRLNTH